MTADGAPTPAAGPATAPVAAAAPDAGLRAAVAFHAWHLVPGLLQGLFLRRPRWVRRFARLDADGRAARLLARLAARHGGVFALRVFRDRALVVGDGEAVRHVLDHSPDLYGPPPIKVKGMSRFEPGAATISTGDDWRRRRRFNEAVLDTGRPVHRAAAGWLGLVGEEVGRALALAAGEAGGTADELRWADLAGLFERIALGVVLGPEARGETAISADLTTLMRAANLPVGKGKPEVLARFQAALRRHLDDPRPGGLVALAAGERAAAGDGAAALAVEGQVPHWLFATRDTLAVNVARALAVIGSHPAIEERVRAELAAADLASPAGVDGLAVLAGVLHEAMRLWPTTPMLSRQALADDVVGGCPVAAGTQVLIPNLSNHRAVAPHPHAVHPDRWAGGAAEPRVNHLGGGAQSCAGAEVALWLGRAVIAALLARGRWRLVAPRLDPARPLPHTLDPYALAWRRKPR